VSRVRRFMFCLAIGEAQTRWCHMDGTALKCLPGRPLLSGAPRAIAPSAFAPFLHSLSHASDLSFTLQATIKLDPSYVMYMVSPYLTSFMLSCLAGLAGTRPRSTFVRKSSVARSVRPPSNTPPRGWRPRA
jgi:hypothetical protein